MKGSRSKATSGKVRLWLALIIGVGGLTWIASQVMSEPKVSTRDVMKFKLHYAQGVLEGIATENHPLIRTNAQKLSRLSQSADWQIRQTPEYQKFTAEFKRQADALVTAAGDQNVDAATVAYFQLTVSCVNCHRYLRGVSRARLLPPTSNPPTEFASWQAASDRAGKLQQ